MAARLLQLGLITSHLKEPITQKLAVLEWATLFAGRMTEPKKGSKEIQAKSRKKEKKGKIPTAENGLRAAGHEGRLPGQADSEAAPEGSLSLEASQTRKLGVSQTGNKAGFSMHGKQGRKGAEIGAALQKGLLGTVMRPEEPLAPGWD